MPRTHPATLSCRTSQQQQAAEGPCGALQAQLALTVHTLVLLVQQALMALLLALQPMTPQLLQQQQEQRSTRWTALVKSWMASLLLI
jgi:hypothetical protein